jgi:hypothetical protein
MHYEYEIRLSIQRAVDIEVNGVETINIIINLEKPIFL